MPPSPICHIVLYALSFLSLPFPSLFVSLYFGLLFPLPHSSLLFYCSLSFFLFACLFHSNLIPTCPRTITKPACLFTLHWGITLFLCYYFFVKSPQYDLPQTALCCPTLIIFSHSATLGHKDSHTHTHTLPHKPTAVCLYVSVFVCVCVFSFLRFDGKPPIYFCVYKC